MEKKKIEKLYELLEDVENKGDTNGAGALRYAIFTLENMQNNNLSTNPYNLLLYEIDAMSYKSVDEKLTITEWKEMNDRLQKAYDNKLITKQQLLHLIALMTNYHCIEG